MSRLWQNALVVPFVLLSGGCAIHYFDSETGTEHIWGFGHMKMTIKPPHDGVQAVVVGTETIGASAGTTLYSSYFALGWQNQSRLAIFDEKASIQFAWPEHDLFSVRLGAELPPTLPGESEAPAINDSEEIQ